MTKTKSIKTHFSGLNNNFNREAETFKRKKKSNKRNRNKPNFCLICKTNVTNLRRHLLSEHKDKCILLDGKLSIKDSVTLPKLVECFRHNTSLIYVDTNGNHLKVYENEVNTTEAGNETQVNCSNLVLNFTNKKEAGEINGNVPFPKYNDAGYSPQMLKNTDKFEIGLKKKNMLKKKHRVFTKINFSESSANNITRKENDDSALISSLKKMEITNKVDKIKTSGSTIRKKKKCSKKLTFVEKTSFNGNFESTTLIPKPSICQENLDTSIDHPYQENSKETANKKKKRRRQRKKTLKISKEKSFLQDKISGILPSSKGNPDPDSTHLLSLCNDIQLLTLEQKFNLKFSKLDTVKCSPQKSSL